MTVHPRMYELAQIGAAMARNALRMTDRQTGDDVIRLLRDQRLLMADLDRGDLELVAHGLAVYVAQMAKFLAVEAGDPTSAERILERFVASAAAGMAGDNEGGDE